MASGPRICKNCGAEFDWGRWHLCQDCKEKSRLAGKANAPARRFKGAGSGALVAGAGDFPADEWPPCFDMLATEEERRFVWAYVQNGGSAADAAKAAYACKSSNAARASAGRCLARPRVQEAILVYSKIALRELAPLAVRTIKDLLADDDASVRLKTAKKILSRTDAIIQKTELAVTLSADDQAVSLLKYLLSVSAGQQALEAAFGAALPRYLAMIEAPPLERTALAAKVIEHRPIEAGPA